jgi:hypothetical protein
MPTDTDRRVYELLHRMPSEGLATAKQLFWTELNYDHANVLLSHREWPDRARHALAEAPIILARHQSQFGSFDVIYAPLSPEQPGRDFPLSLTAERLAVNQLLKDHPYALFVFSDIDERHWHLVNVRYDEEASRRRVFRRIAVGPHERLRTASERIAMLDLAALSPDLFGLSPIAIQQRHDDAFNVEAVTRAFFEQFAVLFYRVRDEIVALPDLASDANALTQTLLDRLLFLYFIQKKGWLNQDPDYLYNRFLADHAERPDSTSYYGQVIYPLFLALSDRGTGHDLSDSLGTVPFLNGGLFELRLASGGLSAAEARLPVSNSTFKALFDELLERFNFTISEDSPLDQEVAIDPEMLGKIFESLVLEREQDSDVDLRRATGSYYTPRPVVAFMCREALTEYLAGASPVERERIKALLDLPPADRLSDEERIQLEGLFSPIEAQALRSLLLGVRACDPAVGSGAFLVGLLQAITWAVGLLDWRLRGDAALVQRNYDYDLQKRVIEHCLYGVDIQAQAVQICELRLWPSLAVDYELPEGAPFTEAVRQVPALPNLAYRVRQGDSLLERLFGQVVQLDELARDRETQEIVEDLQGEKATYFTLAETPEKRRRELRILQLQTALAGKLVDAKHNRLLGYQPPLFGEETAKARREREARQASLREYEELEAQVEQVRRRLAGLRRRGDSRGLSAEELRQQLLGDSEHPTFLWRVDFAEVFQEKGGFDIVIGNPPYLFGEYVANFRDSDRAQFRLATGQFDAYWLFYEKDLQDVLHPSGVHVFINSDALLARDEPGTLRDFILDRTQIRTVSHVGPVFEGVGVSAVVLILAKSTEACKIYDIRVIPYESRAGVFGDSVALPVRAVLRDARRRFLLRAGENYELFDKLALLERLGGYIEISRGEELGKKHLTRISQTGRCPQGRAPVLVGEGIARYGVPVATHCIERASIKKAGKNYLAPKVVVVKTGRSFVATVDYLCLFTLQSVYNVRPSGLSAISCEFLCLLLNSSLMNFILWHQVTAYKKVFPQINQSHIRGLPLVIPQPSQMNLARELYTTLRSDPDNEGLRSLADDFILDLYRCDELERMSIGHWYHSGPT